MVSHASPLLTLPQTVSQVYVGETGSLRARHFREYRGDGSNLKENFEEALAEGCTVWRRVRCGAH